MAGVSEPLDVDDLGDTGAPRDDALPFDDELVHQRRGGARLRQPPPPPQQQRTGGQPQGRQAAPASTGVTWPKPQSTQSPNQPPPPQQARQRAASTVVSLGAPDASAAAEGPAAASEALLARRREAVGEVHPRLRLALTLPWVGSTFPSWFPYFLASTNRSSYLVDWLIFHEEARLPPAGEVPPNVLFFDLGRGGLGSLFGLKLASALGATNKLTRYMNLFRAAFRDFAYIITEYKPTHGTVFADYLAGYSHWSYTDSDVLVGDLPLHLSLEELTEYDVVTYHFGDAFRLYLRGQFSLHRNTPRLARLWTACHHLGAGLLDELEAKHMLVKRLAAEGKHGRTRFLSAEGCYSHAVASASGIRLKFAAKAFADWSDDREFYLVDGAVRRCPQPTQTWLPPGEAPPLDLSNPWADEVGEAVCEPLAPAAAPLSDALPALQRTQGAPVALAIHANCSRWIEERYRLCANMSEDEAAVGYEVTLRDGAWSARRVVAAAPRGGPAGYLEAAFLHLQRWKAQLGRLRYGDAALPRIRGRRLFKLSLRGFEPIDVEYDRARGASLVTYRPYRPEPASADAAPLLHRDVAELTDEEWRALEERRRTARTPPR